MAQKYEKSLKDEIDFKIIDQLHAATINFSNSSIELKKLYVVIIGIAIPAITKLTGGELDMALFVTIYLVSLAFWYLDSFTFFYQEKLRFSINERFKLIKKRAQIASPADKPEVSDFVLEASRTDRQRLMRSFWNRSIAIYVIFLVLNTLGLFLYLFELIQ